MTRGFWRSFATPTCRVPDYDAALARYEKAYPELFVQRGPSIHVANYRAAIDLALVLQKRGESEAANVLLDGAAGVIRTIPRLGVVGYSISDVAIHALRGQKAQALAALRDAEKAGWRGPCWRYYRDFEPNLDSIRNEPEFKAVFADIERDMAQQRARLAARPKDAPLELSATLRGDGNADRAVNWSLLGCTASLGRPPSAWISREFSQL